MKLLIQPSKISSTLIPFTENDIEYYSLSNISHLLSVFKYLLSLLSSYNLSIYNLLIDFIKEIVTERKKYEQLAIEYSFLFFTINSCEKKTDLFLYELQCELYTCYRTIEYKNEELNKDDISNIMIKLHKLYGMYEESKFIQENDENTKGNVLDSNTINDNEEEDLEYESENYQIKTKEEESNITSELSEDIFQGYSSNKITENTKINNIVININKTPSQNTIDELQTVLKQRPKTKQTIVYSNGYIELDDNELKKKKKEEKTIPNIPQLPKIFPNFINKTLNDKNNDIKYDNEEFISHT